jgi:hypothetical protein
MPPLTEVTPGVELFDEAVGRVAPVGHTVTKLAAVASAGIVTVAATPVAAAGIPLVPAKVTLMVVLGPSGPFVGTPVGTRVSSTRTGVMVTKSAGAAGGSAATSAVSAGRAGELAATAMPPPRAATAAVPTTTSVHKNFGRAFGIKRCLDKFLLLGVGPPAGLLFDPSLPQLRVRQHCPEDLDVAKRTDHR